MMKRSLFKVKALSITISMKMKTMMKLTRRSMMKL